VSAHAQKVSGAKSANERQKAPSTKACSTKIEIVKCEAIQHNASLKFSPSVIFRLSQRRYSTISAKALASQIDRLCREVGPGSTF
jgi:hypothetical protein